MAEGRLLDLIRRLYCFGISLLKMDVRQESSRHTEAIDSITRSLASTHLSDLVSIAMLRRVRFRQPVKQCDAVGDVGLTVKTNYTANRELVPEKLNFSDAVQTCCHSPGIKRVSPCCSLLHLLSRTAWLLGKHYQSLCTAIM